MSKSPLVNQSWPSSNIRATLMHSSPNPEAWRLATRYLTVTFHYRCTNRENRASPNELKWCMCWSYIHAQTHIVYTCTLDVFRCGCMRAGGIIHYTYICSALRRMHARCVWCGVVSFVLQHRAFVWKDRVVLVQWFVVVSPRLVRLLTALHIEQLSSRLRRNCHVYLFIYLLIFIWLNIMITKRSVT